MPQTASDDIDEVASSAAVSNLLERARRDPDRLRMGAPLRKSGHRESRCETETLAGLNPIQKQRSRLSYNQVFEKSTDVLNRHARWSG